MNYTTIYNFIKRIPDEALTIFLTILFVLVLYAWKNFLAPFLQIKKRELEKEKNRIENNVNHLTLINIENLHYLMVKEIDDCSLKGFRTTNDTRNFCHILHEYRELGGNTDGEALYNDFLKIPNKPHKSIPLSIGYDMPNQQLLDAMAKYFDRVQNGVIPEEATKILEEGIQKGKIRESKND